MTSKTETFCTRRDLLKVCASCERRLSHSSNREFRKEKDISKQEYEPIVVGSYENCSGWITYPIKEK